MFWKQPQEEFCKISWYNVNFAIFTGKHLCWSLFLVQFQSSTYNFTKKEILAQVFSCEFSRSFWEHLFTEHFPETVAKRCSYKESVLRSFTKFTGNTCARASFLIKLQAEEVCNFIKKEALAQVFSCEFSKIFKNTFS